MDLISTRALETTHLALDGLAARHKAISSNIANADTPDYKRVDVAFEDQLEKIINTENAKELQRVINSSDGVQPNIPLAVNQNQSMMNMYDFKPQMTESELNEANANGNTVDIEQEMANLAKNGMSYNALTILHAKQYRTLAEVLRTQ